VIAIIALLIALLLPALKGARRAARTGVCQSNLKQMMNAQSTYQADFRGYIGALNGRYEDRGLATGGFPNGFHVALQAQQVIAEGAGLQMGNAAASGPNFLPAWTNSNAYTFVLEQFSHVALFQYLGEQMPSPVTACPEDRARLSWRQAPLDIASNPYRPTKSTNTANMAWWPYSSTYQLVPTACATRDPGTKGMRYTQYTTHDQYHGKTIFGGRKVEEVFFPSQKVALHDTQDRHVSKQEIYFGLPPSRQPLAFFDGSVSIRRSGDGNKGEDPEWPRPTIAAQYTYDPDPGFEAPTPAGMNPSIKAGYFRWTRGDLRGVDFGGKEAN
jgi:type II secretory pathway pseudopilin PulG